MKVTSMPLTQRPLAELSALRQPGRVSNNSFQTALFRHTHQFKELSGYFKKKLQNKTADSFWVLSAGASSGQEAASILITYQRAVKEVGIANPPPLQVIAVDADEYTEMMFDENAMRFRLFELPDWETYFDIKKPPQDGQVAGWLKLPYREMVKYAIFDLRETSKLLGLKAFTPGTRGFDAVFFNNVMTYFGNDIVGTGVCNALKSILLKSPDGNGLFFFVV